MGSYLGFVGGVRMEGGMGSACLERGSKRGRLKRTEQKERSETYREMASETIVK